MVLSPERVSRNQIGRIINSGCAISMLHILKLPYLVHSNAEHIKGSHNLIVAVRILNMGSLLEDAGSMR